jgi:SAM-dependent methyltransferase
MAKPGHLGPAYGAQFRDRSVAAAYRHRPAYPPETFRLLAALLPAGCRSVLDLGAGTGDLTRGLVPFADRVDAVEPSAAMLAVARRRALPAGARVAWIEASAETAPLRPPYGLATSGESLHWMAWEVVLPRLRGALAEEGRIALVERVEAPAPWAADLLGLIRRHSTNRAYAPYDLEALLAGGGHFRVERRWETGAVSYRQDVRDYVESIHSRNGFSREGMGAGAAAFDTAARALLARHAAADGTLALAVRARILAGR